VAEHEHRVFAGDVGVTTFHTGCYKDRACLNFTNRLSQ